MQIKVKVIANASKNEVIGFEGDVLKIKCTAAALKGKANAAIILLLSEFYNVSKSSVKILRGKTSSRKVIEINN